MLSCTSRCFLCRFLSDVKPVSELSDIFCLIGIRCGVRRQSKEASIASLGCLHQKEWRISSGLMQGGIVCMY